MEIERIVLNFDQFQEYRSSIEKIKKEDKIPDLLKNIKNEFEKCEVNKPYKKIRDQLKGKKFEIIAKIDGREQKIISGDWKDFHHSLVEEVSSKFFYNISLGITITPDAFDFIRRIPIDEWKNIAKLIKECPSLTDDQIQAFKNGDYSHQVFQKKDWPALALMAFFEQKIDRNQVSILMLYDNLNQLSIPIKNYRLFNENHTINEESFNAILELINMDTFQPELHYNEENKLKLRELIRQEMNENDHFFKGEKLVPYILPPKLNNIILKAKFGDQAIRSNPVLGYSIRDDFTHKTYRDAFVFCRYVSSPKLIHGVHLKAFQIYFHDFAHGVVESGNPNRAFFLELASELEQQGLLKTLNIILDRDVKPDMFKNLDQILYEIDLDKQKIYFQNTKDEYGFIDDEGNFKSELPIYIEIEKNWGKLIDVITDFIIERSDFKKEFIFASLLDVNETNARIINRLIAKGMKKDIESIIDDLPEQTENIIYEDISKSEASNNFEQMIS